MKNYPPRIFLRFFRWYCHPKLVDHIEGDLIEVYQQRFKKFGKRKADGKFIIDVLLLFRPRILRPLRVYNNLNTMDMLANYIKVAFRNILRYKVYSSINVFGLAVGMAASMLIILYIADELSYDRFLKDSDRIFRIGSNGRFQGNEFRMAVSSSPIAQAMLSEMPEVTSATRLGRWKSLPIRYDDKVFIEKKALVGDSNFFQFFSFSLVSGDPQTALKGTDKVVITEATAKRFFGSENPLGKSILRGDDRKATEVTGVVRIPSNSHLQFDMIFSGESWRYMENDHWSNTFLYTYIKTNSPDDAVAVQKKLELITVKNIGPELQEITGLSPQQFKTNGYQFGFFLQPLLDIHLKSGLESEITPQGNIQYVYIFGSVAVFILLIACINFMNLSTARSATRAKEVGVRKSVGAFRSRLISQFLSESMIYSVIATILALAIIGFVLKPFNVLAGKNLSLSLFAEPVVVIGILLFAVFTGFIAGSYPAFYLTAFKPVDVLKGKVTGGLRNSTLRNSLVTFQFMISIALILGSLVVYRQLAYMQVLDMGFDKENVVDVGNGWSLGNNIDEFRNELALHPEFRSASFASGLPPHIVDGNLFRKGGTEQDIVLNVITVDFDHLSAMGYTMADGRFFSADFPSDSTAIVINEEAYKQLGFKQLDGNTLINFNAESPAPFQLIGVVKDFNFENLRSSVKPMAMLLNAGKNSYMVGQANNDIAIRIAPGDAGTSIDKLESIWKKYSSSPFEFSFLDENIDALFRSERRMGQIVLIFTVLTIIIACLGLFGLATYLGEQRGKEISIRKVVGASVIQVIILLLKDFAVLIGIAFIIAAPVGWYFLNIWLQDFAYRINVDFWMVLVAGISTLLIAILTISIQSIKVARENPVNALKSE